MTGFGPPDAGREGDGSAGMGGRTSGQRPEAQGRRTDGPRTAFVLAGGGTRGAVQVGMLAELVARGVKADRVYGASVGAVNGAAYCGDPTPEGVQRLDGVWRRLTGEDVFPRSPVHGPWMWFRRRNAVHPDTGLRQVLADGLSFDRLEDAEVPLEVVTTSLTDGRERWLDRGSAIEAVAVSAAIPGLFPPVAIDGDLLMDGGVVNNVPISRAVEGGATRIFVLLCGPLHFRPPQPKRPVEAALVAFFVAVQARFARELRSLPPGVEVIVLSGGGDPTAAYRDFSSTPALIEEGRAEAAAVLDRLDGPGAVDGQYGRGAVAPSRARVHRL